MQTIKGFPRRRRVDLYTRAEAAIRDAIFAVEAAGADVRLTDAVNLLSQAQDKVADYTERDDPDGVMDDAVFEARPRTVADDIEEFRKMPEATRRLINRLGQVIVDSGVNITIES